MKNISPNPNSRLDCYQQIDRQRLKTAPSAQQMSPNQQKRTEQTILPFQCQQYQFLNRHVSQITALKTIVSMNLNTQKLQKIVKLTHPNIIAIRKIVKSSPREMSPSSRSQTHYSFFYEPVNFSLQHLSQHQEQHPRLYNLLLTLDLRSALSSIIDYLQQADIYYTPRLQDIGISIEGLLKIYVSPKVVFESKYDPNMQRTLQAISQWWGNYQYSLGSNMFKKEKKNIQLQPPKLANHSDLQLDQFSVPESILERQLGQLLEDEDQPEKPFAVELKESTSSLSKLGSLQLQKIKRIDQEIKFIRQRLNQKTPKNTLKDSQNTSERQLPYTPERQAPKQKGNPKPYQIKQSESPHKGEKNYYRQPIQQNINCINIYNHNNHISPGQIAAIPNYLPKHQQIMPKNFYQPHMHPEYLRDHDEQYSQDTYDIEFDTQLDMPQTGNSNTNTNNYRNTFFTPERELSQYSEHMHKKKNEGRSKQFRTKPYVNQVCNKNYTESAGPLQFKSIVSKYIKSTKKDNAYEQPNQIQPEHIRDKQQYSSSNYNTQSLRSLSVEKGLKQKQFSKGRVESVCDKQQADIKRIHSQHDFYTQNRVQTNGDSQIEQKVKKALQKTKNAIALLNRVKSSKAVSKPFPFQ